MCQEQLEAVDLVDVLLTKYGMGITPTGDELNRAIELGLDVTAIREVAEETYATVSEDDDEWDE